MLGNEKYIGDALLQKTYTVNTLEKKRVANNGLAPKYFRTKKLVKRKEFEQFISNTLEL